MFAVADAEAEDAMAAVGVAAAEVVLVLDGGGCERESEPTSAAPAVSLASIIAHRFWPKGRSDTCKLVDWECGARFRKLMTFSFGMVLLLRRRHLVQ